MSRRRTHVGTLAIVVACALAGTLLTAGSADARSSGFHIYNLTAHPLELRAVKDACCGWGSAKFDKGNKSPLPPAEGYVLMPGVPQHIELVYSDFTTYGANLQYRGHDGGGDLVANILVSTGRSPGCSIGRPSNAFAGYQCTVKGSTITILEPPGTVHEVPRESSQEQAEILRQLCRDNSSAKCKFKPIRRTPTLTQSHLVGKPVTNCDDETEVEFRIKEEDKVGSTNSVGIEIGTEVGFEAFGAKVKVEIKAKYGHEWLTEHSFAQDETLRVKPGHVAWLAVTEPILRDTGDFTLELGNTTWQLRDVSFETPDPRVGEGSFVKDGYELPPDEYASACKHKRPGTAAAVTQLPTHFARMQWKGTSGHDVLLAGPESHTVRGFRGSDLLRGGQGHDTLHGGRHDDTVHGGRHHDALNGGRDEDILDGGRGRDTLNGGRDADILDGGRGRDTLNGGPAADTMIDNSGPTLVRTGPDPGPGRDIVNVRDGRDDDTVICGSRRSTVLVDAGDSVIGPCGNLARSASTR
jgi:hypothetical protein